VKDHLRILRYDRFLFTSGRSLYHLHKASKDINAAGSFSICFPSARALRTSFRLCSAAALDGRCAPPSFAIDVVLNPVIFMRSFLDLETALADISLQPGAAPAVGTFNHYAHFLPPASFGDPNHPDFLLHNRASRSSFCRKLSPALFPSSVPVRTLPSFLPNSLYLSLTPFLVRQRSEQKRRGFLPIGE